MSSLSAYDKVRDLMDELENVTEWEYDFLMNVAEYEGKRRDFSDDQTNVIDRMYDKYCA